MDPELLPAIATAQEAIQTISSLETAGCVVSDGLLSCRVQIPAGASDGVPHRDFVTQLRDISDVHLRYEQGPLAFELGGTPGTLLEFLGEPEGDPASVFEGDALQAAERAWQGDVSAASSLTGNWRGDVSVKLQSPFEKLVPSVAWRVVRNTSVLVNAFAEYPWWRSGELIREKQRPVIVGIVGEQGVVYRTPSFVAASLDVLPSLDVPVGMATRRKEVESSSASRLPDELPLPEELLPSAPEHADGRIEKALQPKAEASAWAWLSNSVVASGDGGTALLEFFGYRRKTFEVRGEGFTGEPGQQAFRLYRWATVEESPDRILAVRQVVSLQDGADLPKRPDDVVTAAEPLYRALRAGEVAAVLETQRQARSIAIETARQGAEAAQAGAKSATERTIASLGAVAGVAVANATAVLSAEDSRGIALGIAALFIFLALWAVLVEGPPMRSPILSLGLDLPKVGYLLSKKEIDEILDMTVVKKARRSVLRVRIVTPLVYALGAAVTIAVAHARFDLQLPWN
jgi:hypothetical protein